MRTNAERRKLIGYRLVLEELEDRTVLAPSWEPIGPAPQLDPNGFLERPNENYSGRVTALALSQDQSALFIGTAGGGIWRTTDVYSGDPKWVQVSDNVTYDAGGAKGKPVPPELGAGLGAIGALAADPTSKKVIYAGTGEANYSADSHWGAGFLASYDGGTSWHLVATGPAKKPTAFVKHAFSKIIVSPAGTIFASLVMAAGVVSDRTIVMYRMPMMEYTGVRTAVSPG